jgi:hypothetical protein
MNKLLMPIVVLVGLVVVLLIKASALRDQAQAQRGTYRPRAKAPGAGQQDIDPGTPQVLSRRELAGLRDAYSSAGIDAAQPLRCCCGCQALYHASSVEALRRENNGRCAVCSGTAFAEVRLAD